jgi:hypothetical protein
LNEHILIAAELLSAARAGDNAAFADSNARWHENVDQIGALLSNANPENWSVDDLQAMMKAHLDKTLEEAVARLKGDRDAAVAAYDQIHDDILHMAGMLTEGIITQFPKNFK